MIEIYAGKTAMETIKEHGFKQELFTSFLGASGGPKFFCLYSLDTEIVNIELAKYPAEEISFLEDSEKTILLNKLNQWALSEAINNF